MLDFIGQEIKVNDIVAFALEANELSLAIIHEINNENIVIYAIPKQGVKHYEETKAQEVIKVTFFRNDEYLEHVLKYRNS